MSVALMLISACSDGEKSGAAPTSSRSESSQVTFSNDYNKNDTWLVYWYLCGTDLESDDGSATADFSELVDVDLPPNVKVLVQTGGAVEWQNEAVPNGKIGRFLYDNEDLKVLQTLPDADMGSKSTLIDFLRYGKENFKADHQVFVFWNHGGGSIGGICSDERTGNALSLNDLTEAFSAVYEKSPENPPFELIGFDACLMATYDTANSIYGFSRFMVGSEELEPGSGWEYTGWVGALAKNPAMNGASLGKAICDTYIKGCQEYDVDDSATLSLIDLSKIPKLTWAYEAFGLEALQNARRDTKGFFSSFGRGAQRAENYGGNTRKSGYTDMVDLADLARQSKSLLPKSSGDLIKAIDEAVVYRVQGDYRKKGSGISGFHSYEGSEDYLVNYLDVEAAPMSQKFLYYYLIYGELPDSVTRILDDGSLEKAINKMKAEVEEEKPAPPIEDNVPSNVTTLQPIQQQKIFNVSSLEDLPVDVDKDGNAFVKLTEEQMDMLSSIHCQLVYMDIEKDIILYLGSDANIDADWDKGIFKDNFTGYWPCLDGHIVYMEIVAENDDYNFYNVPIKLNGVECNLQVVYNYKDEKYHILGARKGIDDNNMGNRELIKLKKGDKITTIHYAATISGDDDDLTAIDVETFTLTSNNPKFEDEDMGDGLFGYCFEFISPTEDSALSQLVEFEVKGDTITTSVDVD
ncbi:MAG: clostripain [Selenomonadaceae bacterium]|nr:clostripain [Selenomonadaceae bacterium]